MENQNNLIVNELAADALRESAKWTMFLSIIGFIGIAFMLLAGLSMSFVMSNIPVDDEFGVNPFGAYKAYLGLFYIIFAVIYFFPVKYLYNYSKGMKNALSTRNNDLLSDALVNLKSHHKFLGIMTIVIIALYILMFIGMMVFFASAASRGGF